MNLDFVLVKWKAIEGNFMEKCDVRAIMIEGGIPI